LKLFIKIRCVACRGEEKTWYGLSCPYCTFGKTYIEASEKAIIRYFKDLESEKRKELIRKILGEQK